MKSTLRRAALSFIFAASTAIFSVSQADAGGSWGGSSGGSSGGWGSSGGVSLGSTGSWGSSGGVSMGSTGSWGSSGGSSGGHIGLFQRVGDRIAARREYRHERRASWGSSGGGSIGSGSTGYSTYRAGGSSGGASSGTYSMSYGSFGSAGSSSIQYSVPTEYGMPVEYGTPVEQGIPVESPANPTPPSPQPEVDTTDNEAVLKVDVPADAIVYVNDRQTKTPGESRTYISRNLKTGFNYAYEVRAEVTRNGKKLSQVKLIDLRVGLTKELAFDFDDAEPVVTSLTLNVPANAKVTLGGVETTATGTSRTFSTTRLNRGDLWSDYKVVVTVERDGRQISKDQTLDVKAGDDVKLDFEFSEAAETVAALR